MRRWGDEETKEDNLRVALSRHHRVLLNLDGLRKDGLGLGFHEVGEWVVELIRVGSGPTLVDLSWKPFCGHLFHHS